MTIKKMIFINTIITFILCFITHNVYDWFPSNIIAVFFPVNESIWEHMKLLFTAIILYSFIEKILLKKFKILYSNLLLTTFIKGVLIIPIYLVMFLPLYLIIGENFIIAITVMLISIFIVNVIGSNIIDDYEIKNQKFIGLIGILIIYIIMGIFTFYPPETIIFYDIKKNAYGIIEK